MSKRVILKLFKLVDINIKYHTNQNDYDIDVLDDSFYTDILHRKTLGLGESYMNSKFDTPNLELLLTKLSKLNDLSALQLLSHLNFIDYIYFIYYIFWKVINVYYCIFFNQQTIEKSKEVGEQHYDLPNILYENMLGTTKFYSCAYFTKNDKRRKKYLDRYGKIDIAQNNKCHLIINKLQINDNDNILEIGCGWGFISYIIAKKFPKSKVLSISISKEQIDYCNKMYSLPNLKFELKDYRDLTKNSYDKIFSIGMFEHVGYQNYNDFFNITYSLLKSNGLMLLHTIVNKKVNYGNDPFFHKYIFPGANLTSISQILKSIENTKYVVEDVHCFGLNYSKTLNCWYDNFQESFDTLNEYDPVIFNDKFKRMWEMYLKMSIVGFNTRKLNLAQFVFSKNKKDVYDRYSHIKIN